MSFTCIQWPFVGLLNITFFEIKQDASAKNISPYALIKRDILLEFTSNT
jgi:hypothetical protein